MTRLAVTRQDSLKTPGDILEQIRGYTQRKILPGSEFEYRLHYLEKCRIFEQPAVIFKVTPELLSLFGKGGLQRSTSGASL
jgi:hypothetical protein